jgi:anthranilate synthase component 1
MLNINFLDFKKNHKKKKNQIIYHSINTTGINEIRSLIDNFLNEKNSFVFESVEKGVIKGRYTIFGKNPDKIWEFNNNNSYLFYKNKKFKIKGNPKKVIEKIIQDFQFKIPKSLPPISSLISGYFSYDIIRYIEKVSNTCIDDLKLPDCRILRPKTLVIHDNLKKKLYFIQNCFNDEIIKDYKKKYK